jgi:uncharacterized cupin superfamily protein
MPKIMLSAAPQSRGTRYPAPHDVPCRDRSWLRLGEAGGLSQFGVNLVTLPPGVWSSQRHWHALEDEFVYVACGEVVLVDDAGEHPMRAGECAGFPAGQRNGHHFINRSVAPAVLLVVGSRNEDDYGEYPDIDMKFTTGRYGGRGGFVRKDGSGF